MYECTDRRFTQIAMLGYGCKKWRGQLAELSGRMEWGGVTLMLDALTTLSPFVPGKLTVSASNSTLLIKTDVVCLPLSCQRRGRHSIVWRDLSRKNDMYRVSKGRESRSLALCAVEIWMSISSVDMNLRLFCLLWLIACRSVCIAVPLTRD